jgi:3-oxoadipate enol-lactonase
MNESGSAGATASDGTHLFVLDEGHGEPVLLIPGLGYASWCWSRQVGPLSRAVRVLALDNRGTGHSGKPSGPYSIHQMAEDAFSVLTQRDAVPAHIVGTSMGGYIAMTLAKNHPEAVRSLVLIATTIGGPGSHAVPEETVWAWQNAAHLDAAGFARETMPISFAPGWVEEHPAEYEELLADRLSAPTRVDAWLAQFMACTIFLREGLQSPIRHPTVIVHGTADRVVPYENAAHLARAAPEASLVTLEGAGHLCWIERAAEVNDIILDFVTADTRFPEMATRRRNRSGRAGSDRRFLDALHHKIARAIPGRHPVESVMEATPRGQPKGSPVAPPTEPGD